ncbi:hemerythrin domain-containing protein [Ramlibacter albus]|uniref:Hemerythrin domain-containing protein n=1 Tax=Ramlibacter albus TaxID=2079448 RepID=A0A923M5F2_9BURK|nr:hemerythrin domain-containing protein [Ramlibacter albus]MBC5763091.1 hemerythrin domain-containing protein [Ramlibacter albus]
MTYTDSAEPVHVDAPLAEFSECHHEFVARLHSALYLPELVAAAAKARAMAEDVIDLFTGGVLQHHQDEERELFPAVVAAARPGDEEQEVRAMVRRLVDEHRDTERRWKELEPAVRLIATGGTPAIDHVLLEDLVQHFFAHAHYEEEHFLPAAQRILGRQSQDMAALGKALHTRHAAAS